MNQLSLPHTKKVSPPIRSGLLRSAALLMALTAALLGGCTGSNTPGDHLTDPDTGDPAYHDAQSPGREGDRCPGTMLRCEGTCIDPDSDPHHCGHCDTPCEEEHLCVQGRCLPPCPDYQTRCHPDGECVDLSRSRSHCGQCDHPCPDGQLCEDGHCLVVCPPGQTECDSQCIDTDSDPLHCGHCQAPCPEGQVCSDGECAFTCYPGLILCGDQCADITTSHLHCGGCNRPCPPSNYCAGATCQLWCPGDLQDCGGTCVDTANTLEHCGKCNLRCPPGSRCLNGQCFVKVTGIRLNRMSLTLQGRATGALMATVEPAGATNRTVIWTSDDDQVATVDNNGNVTGVAPGAAVITATTEDGAYRARCLVTVWQALTGINIVPDTLTLSSANFTQLELEPVPATALLDPELDILWSTSNPAVAMVDNTGTVRGIGPGQAVIFATDAASASSPNPITGQCAVTVTTVPVTGLRVEPLQLALRKGQEGNLMGVVSPPNASNKNLIWISSDPGTVTVDSAGKVRGMEGGTAYVSAITHDGGFRARSTVTISVPLTWITVSPKHLTLERHTTGQVNANLIPPDTTEPRIIWTTDNPQVATVNTTGTVLATGVGSATITATSVAGNHTDHCQVQVWEEAVTSIDVSPRDAYVWLGEQTQLTATVSPPDATDQRVLWTSTNPAVARVDSHGLVTALAYGETTIVATSANNEAISAQATITVPVPVTGITISHTMVELDLNEPMLLTVQVMPENATNKEVEWHSSDPELVSVTPDGQVTAHRSVPAPVIITATTVEGGFTATCAVDVTTLYEFTEHQFTTCGQSGRTGPTLAQCRSAYSSEQWAAVPDFFSVDGGIQEWVVPFSGAFRIEAFGAQGGGFTSARGGKGARMRGDFNLQQGQVLRILVGHSGSAGSSGSCGCGGGGGTFVVAEDGPLIVAGAGGGQGGCGDNTGNGLGVGGVTETAGTRGNGGGGNGGTNGSGGGATTDNYPGGGGGGYSGDGAYGVRSSGRGCETGVSGFSGTDGNAGRTAGGKSFLNGGAGGRACYVVASYGGFGGGGGEGGCGGAGGGGYSGGGGGQTDNHGGGGGGSFNGGTNQSNSAGVQTGHGEVTIKVISGQ